MAKKRLLKRMALWLGILLAIALVGILAFLHTVDFSISPERLAQVFENQPYQPHFGTYTHDGQPMHYVEVGDPEKPVILFVHGSPGSWDAFVSYMTQADLLAHARIISVDRPGFGKSGAGTPERSVKRQAAAISAVLQQRNAGHKAILVGHSYGGPVIARMAMDFPALVGGLVFVAASIDPRLEETKWYQVPANWPPVRWILPGMLDVTNQEILALRDELENMRPLWRTITAPVTVIQGEADTLVPAANADFAAQMLTQAASVEMVRIDSMNHFVPWNRADLILRALRQHLDHLTGAIPPAAALDGAN